MKKMIMTAIAMAAPATFAGDSDQQILEKLEQLQRTVMEQQAQINTLKSELAEQGSVGDIVRSELDAAIESKGLAQVKDIGPVIQLPKQIDGLKIKGDVRFRYENTAVDDYVRDANNNNNVDAGEVDDVERNRFLTRFRLGAVWQTSEGWEIGAGLITGVNGVDPADNANDTWSDGTEFETGDIMLDYAYAKHNWGCWSVTVGQHENPYVSSFMLWDEDVRPVGATAEYKMDGVFATAGWYEVRNLSNNDGPGENSVQMWAGQIGYEMEAEGMDMLVAASYYMFSDDFSYETPAVTQLNNIPQDAEYKVGDIYAELGMPVGDAKMTMYGHSWMNFGASDEAGQSYLRGNEEGDDNDMGYVLGLKGEMGKFSLGYAYARCEADSAFPTLVNNEFGSGNVNDSILSVNSALNSKGHVFRVGYAVTENFSINGTAMLAEEIEEMDANLDQESDLYQIDLTYKF